MCGEKGMGWMKKKKAIAITADGLICHSWIQEVPFVSHECLISLSWHPSRKAASLTTRLSRYDVANARIRREVFNLRQGGNLGAWGCVTCVCVRCWGIKQKKKKKKAKEPNRYRHTISRVSDTENCSISEWGRLRDLREAVKLPISLLISITSRSHSSPLYDWQLSLSHWFSTWERGGESSNEGCDGPISLKWSRRRMTSEWIHINVPFITVPREFGVMQAK